MTKTKDLVEDAVIYIPRNTIHPDPDQPRVKVDAELQASIDSEGIIQAITVRPHPDLGDEWMIVDGERRWRGGEHLKTIPCRIRLDLEAPVDRLITQLSANTGKPLSPIEQARAFKKALEADPKLSQAKLAERLGIPRTTIGDRIRLIEIHPAWMKLIESGRLQVSHAPLIHQYRAVPDEYQVKAANYVTVGEGWQMQKYSEKGDIIPIAAFRKVLHEAFKDYVIRLDDVRSYKGPVLEIEEENWSYGGASDRMKKVKYAADIKLWRPIKREADKRAKKARESSPSSFAAYQSPMAAALKTLKAAGIDVPFRKSNGHLDTTKLKDGEVKIFDSGWAPGIHPQTLLDHLDASTLIRVQGSYGEGSLVTTDAAAVAAARKAYRAKVVEVSKKVLAPLAEKLSDKVLAAYAVTGPGVKGLAGYMDLERGDERTVAVAIGIPVDGGEISQADAERLLSALAVCAAQEIKLPNSWTIEDKIRQGVGSPAFKLPAPPYVSKTRAKKMARAAGKQVGDPTRAKDVDVGEIRAAVEAGTVPEEEFEEEEELVEA